MTAAELGALLQGGGSIIQGLAIIGAALIARNTIKNWRKQSIALRRSELAEWLTHAAWDSYIANNHIRYLTVTPDEEQKAKDKASTHPRWDGADPKGQMRMVRSQVMLNRLEDVQPIKRELESKLIMAKTLMGREMSKAVSELHSQFKKYEWLAVAINRPEADEDYYDDVNRQAARKMPVLLSSEETALQLETVRYIRRECARMINLKDPSGRRHTRRRWWSL